MVSKKVLLLMAAALLFPALTWAVEPTVSLQKASVQTLTLAKCLELAYTNNQTFKSAHQAVVIAQESVKKAQGGFYPTLDYKVSTNQSEDPTKGVSWYWFGDTQKAYYYEYPNPYYAGSISATYPLYTGGKLQNTLKIAKLQLQVAEEKERNAKQNLTYKVKAAYHQVWLAEESLVVAQASYDNMARHAERINTLYQVGNTSKFELLRAQVNRDNLKPAVIKAENGITLAKLALSTLIGLPSGSPFHTDFNPDQYTLPAESTLPNLETAITTAFANRSELKQMQLAVELQNVQVNLANSYLKPNVALTGSYQGYGDDLNVGSWPAKYWTLVLGVQGNLFDATNKPAAKIAKAQLEQQRIVASDLKDTIRQNVEQVVNSIKESLETAKSTQASIVLAKESLRLTEVRFQAGMATSMDVMDAQLALDQAANGYYSSVAAYLTAVANFELVTGQD